jgi:hypothetical protein
MRKSMRVILILISWAALAAGGFTAVERSALAQENFPIIPKLAPKGFFPGKPVPSVPSPSGLFPGKWKLEISEDFVKPKEPELKKENPFPAILEKLRAPGPAIKIDVKKPEWCDPKAKNGNKNGKNGKNGDKNGGAEEEEEDEDPSAASEGWDVDRPWISVNQG